METELYEKFTEEADQIEEAVKVLEVDIRDLRTLLPSWVINKSTPSGAGAKKFSDVGKRIVLSAKRVQALISEHTLPR
jgi:hypothetical protein